MSHDRQLILEARHRDPFSYLGMHPVAKGVIARAFHPHASAVTLIGRHGQGRWPLEQIDDAGLFEVEITDHKEVFGYELEFTSREGTVWRTRDPYSFLPQITDYDQHLFNEGNHYQAYEKLGAHLCTVDGIQGVRFAVWAPSAERVSVVGDFCAWDGRTYMMRMHGSSGIWEIFIPGVTVGTIYKYEIRTGGGDIYLKADPYGFCSEVRPATGSVVYDISGYEWDDTDYMDRRAGYDFQNEPISVYEVHLGSWMRVPETGGMLSYRDLAHRLASHVKGMGFTHIELLPVAEHPLDESWGYQVCGYFAPTTRFGSPEDFMYFVEHMHKHDIGVIVDWVPAHFPKDQHGLAWFDGTALYEHADPRQGEHRDWGTKIFNFGRNEVRNFLISNALFWLERYHIDGLRVDAVASILYLDYSREQGEWIPNKYGGRENIEAIDFLRQLNQVVHELHPGAMTIAEESTSWPAVSRPTYVGGLGFTMKWNMGWMNDILEFFAKDPIYRKYHHDSLTFALLYAFHENFVLPLSHDEVVHGKRSLLSKMPGDNWQQFANLRLLLGYMYAQPGKKLLFQGVEFGQWDEWNSQKSLDWHLGESRPHWALMRYLSRLNHLYREQKALHALDFSPEGFDWVDFSDTDNSIISFIRWSPECKEHIVCVFNCTPTPHHGYRIGVPEKAHYREIMNSDSELFWGSNMGNLGGADSEAVPCHGKTYSVSLTIPPLGVVYLKPS